jgi:hypothetical protein
MARSALSGRPASAPPAPPSVAPIDGGRISTFVNNPSMTAEGMRREGIIEPIKVTILAPAAPTAGTIEALAQEIFPGHFLRGKLNIREPMPFPLLDRILAEAEKSAGPLWSAEDLDQEKADMAAWRNCQLLLEEASIGNVSRLLRRKLDEVAKQIAKGESPPPPDTVDGSQLAQYRGVIRLAQSEISARVHARLLPKVQRVRGAAISMALARAEIERRTAKEDGFPFCASQTLRSLVFCALRGFEDPVANFMPGQYASLSPSNQFFCRTLFDAGPAQAGLT